MLIVEEKEIFNSIAKNIVTSEIDDKWDEAILKFMVIGNTVDFNLNFKYSNRNSENTKLNNAFYCSMDVLKLHKLTNEHPNYKKWNRATFTLHSNSKCNIQYIWDEDLQNEVDIINNESPI
jgi:hypothetical protein